MAVLTEIEAADAQGRAIWDIYAMLRTARCGRDREELLRRAGHCADELGRSLRRVAMATAEAYPGEETREALNRLGALMEQVMIQEREFRIATGGSWQSTEPAAMMRQS